MTEPRSTNSAAHSERQLGRIHNSFFTPKQQYDGTSDHALQLNQELKREGNKPLNKHSKGTSKNWGAQNVVRYAKKDLPLPKQYSVRRVTGQWQQPGQPKTAPLTSKSTTAEDLAVHDNKCVWIFVGLLLVGLYLVN